MSLIILDHPIIEHKLTILRNKKTGTKEFREIISEVATLLCYEATRNTPMMEAEIETPVTKTRARTINEDHYAFIPILRAGTGMIQGIINLIPNAKIGHIGMYRNEETLEPVKYYYKAPKNLSEKEIIIIDPMLATGGSIVNAIKMLKDEGANKIKVLCIIAAPEGIKKVEEMYPDVEIYTAALDNKLNEKGYIVPGLGDAGDRIFGTK